MENKIVGSLECDIFIVPNSAWKFNAEAGCTYNNSEFIKLGQYWGSKLDEKFVEIWGVGKSVEVDNLHCDGYLPVELVDIEAAKKEYADEPEFLAKRLKRLEEKKSWGMGGVEDTAYNHIGFPWCPGNRYWFPVYLPMSLFAGKKEGDVIEFDLGAYDKGTIHVTAHLNQRDYRYRSHGDFEEVLQHVTA